MSFIGIGTLINAGLIIAGGVVGIVFKRFIKDNYQDIVLKATGFAVMFMGVAGTMSEMLVLSDDGTKLSSTGTINIVVSLALGALIGEIIGIDNLFEKFGAWLRHISRSDGDSNFINGFVTATLTVGIGAMGIMGSIQDGIYHDPSILIAKGTIDFVIILVMASSMGKGAAFSSVSVLIIQGLMTVLAAGFGGLLTDAMLSNVSMVGGILIFFVGLNLVWPKTISTANLLPSLIITIIMTLF